ncbi:hypothetical protein NDU88_006211 [Pleurodeles waltl]|uniref:Uncharacterized protein n=1 Tax=Pleurodeles waltl TaxID=8319 RepID=A0AAV7SNX9_PLEWA|nr:hypothetical protein NDU88_006211 [Pleurodeles waltl]
MGLSRGGTPHMYKYWDEKQGIRSNEDYRTPTAGAVFCRQSLDTGRRLHTCTARAPLDERPPSGVQRVPARGNASFFLRMRGTSTTCVVAAALL